MSNTYIEQKIAETKIHSSFSADVPTRDNNTEIIIENTDVISSMLSYYNPDLHCAVLNHMCYLEPVPELIHHGLTVGREEELCCHSALKDILLGCQEFYNYFKDKKHNHVHGGLYESRIMYTPHLEFCRDGNSCEYSVIGAQAPKWKPCGVQYHRFTAAENSKALEERIDLVFNVAAINNVDILILGNFGCNVYGQNPAEIASIFKKLLDTKYKTCFKTVVIPIENPKHRSEFENVFK